MVNLIIDDNKLTVPEGTTIMEAASSVGIEVPSLCYLKDINEIGACRICVVEIEGISKLVPSCNNLVTEGMVIKTNSKRVREARKLNMELLLSQHDSHCPTCVRSGNCSLQTIANDLNILDLSFEKKVPKNEWSKDFPLIREESKCIKCMRCIQVCDNIQSLNVWDIEGTGSRTTVDVSHHRNIKDSDCSLCGQCITHCPVGALRERDDTDLIFDAIDDPDKITVVQIAPSIRTAWGEAFGLTPKEATAQRLVAVLKKIGFDYVFDTDFSADLTIMEEGSELLERFNNGELSEYPMFTSCCPGWVRFLKSQYPEMVPLLSTAKSPQQMFGAVTKSYYAKLLDVFPTSIFSASIMPCVAKKHEAALPNMDSCNTGHDVDCVLTTRELVRLIKSEHINPMTLEEQDFDQPLGVSTGAGTIFGATGGVMEAALRSAYYLVTGENPHPDAFQAVRGMDGWKESTFEISGIPIRVAVASGLKNARNLLDAIQKKEVSYEFVEIMACPGGCAGGGGQPIHEGCEMADDRGCVLYDLDKNMNIRFSHENQAVLNLYRDYMEKPLSHKSHELLHTDHSAWEMPKSSKF